MQVRQFQQSVIQSLSALELFRGYFISMRKSGHSSVSVSNNLGSFNNDFKSIEKSTVGDQETNAAATIVQYLSTIICLLWKRQKKKDEGIILHPGKFVKLVYRFQGRRFNPHRQEDASQFLIFLLDLIHSSLNRADQKDRRAHRDLTDKQLFMTPTERLELSRDQDSILHSSHQPSDRDPPQKKPLAIKIAVMTASTLRQTLEVEQRRLKKQVEQTKNDDHCFFIKRIPPALTSTQKIESVKEESQSFSIKRYNTDIQYDSSSIRVDGSQFGRDTLERASEQSWKAFVVGNKSIIVDLFLGQHKATLKCRECQAVSVKFEHFFSLNVPFPGSVLLNQNKSFTLAQCINEFSRTQRLDSKNKWECRNCEKKVSANRALVMWKAPNILAIILKRFSFKPGHKAKKITNLVDFPLRNLDLNQFLQSDQTDTTNLYDLASVVCHEGNNLEQGHYYSITRRSDTQHWYKLDDSVVTQIKREEKVVNKHAYVLFYEKVTDFVTRQEISVGDMIASPMDTVFSSINSQKNLRNLTSSVNTRSSTNNKPPLGKLRTLKEINNASKRLTESGTTNKNGWMLGTGNSYGKSSISNQSCNFFPSQSGERGGEDAPQQVAYLQEL